MSNSNSNSNNKNTDKNIISSSTPLSLECIGSPSNISSSPIMFSKDAFHNNANSMMLDSCESPLVFVPPAPNNYTSYLIDLCHHTAEEESMLSSTPYENDNHINNYGSMFELINNNSFSNNYGAQTVPSL